MCTNTYLRTLIILEIFQCSQAQIKNPFILNPQNIYIYFTILKPTKSSYRTQQTEIIQMFLVPDNHAFDNPSRHVITLGKHDCVKAEQIPSKNMKGRVTRENKKSNITKWYTKNNYRKSLHLTSMPTCPLLLEQPITKQNHFVHISIFSTTLMNIGIIWWSKLRFLSSLSLNIMKTKIFAFLSAK